MKYIDLKKRQQDEVNAFPFGFAFDQKQFEEMMQKFGLNKDDTDKIYSIGAGGYVKKTDAPAMHEMFERHKKELQQAIDEDKTGKGFICEMFTYELANHEYGYTRDLDETLEALGYTREEIRKKKNLYNGLIKAMSKFKD